MKRQYLDRQQVHCPLCHKGRVVDIAAEIDLSRVKIYGPPQADKAQFFLKCPKCGQQIGISLT